MPKRSSTKDPNKPKGRTSAYAFFVQERRETYRQEGKKVDFQEFSRECADLWKGKSEEDGDRDPYIKKADADKVRYEREMAAYNPPPESPGKKNKKRKPQDKTKPKRALSAFLYFSGELRPKYKAKHPGSSVGELAKMLGSAWQEMKTDSRKPFEEMAKKDRERYDYEMDLWKKGDFTRNDEAEEIEYSEEED